jgi:hypothetical protein
MDAASSVAAAEEALCWALCERRRMAKRTSSTASSRLSRT